MEHKMWYDEQDQLVYLEFRNEYLEKDVPEIRAKLIELLEGKTIRQMIAILTMSNKVQNRETRQQSNQALNDAKVTEIAFVGGSSANRIIAKVLLKTGAIKINGDFFATKEKAIAWVKNRR